MKTIIAAVTLLTSLSAHAVTEEWLEAPNRLGGKIVLMSTPCKPGDKENNGKLVVANTPEGDAITGCWWFLTDMAHVVWDHGTKSSYSIFEFTVGKRER
jgi:hypothetical protein